MGFDAVSRAAQGWPLRALRSESKKSFEEGRGEVGSGILLTAAVWRRGRAGDDGPCLSRLPVLDVDHLPSFSLEPSQRVDLQAVNHVSRMSRNLSSHEEAKATPSLGEGLSKSMPCLALNLINQSYCYCMLFSQLWQVLMSSLELPTS